MNRISTQKSWQREVRYGEKDCMWTAEPVWELPCESRAYPALTENEGNVSQKLRGR